MENSSINNVSRNPMEHIISMPSLNNELGEVTNRMRNIDIVAHILLLFLLGGVINQLWIKIFFYIVSEDGWNDKITPILIFIMIGGTLAYLIYFDEFLRWYFNPQEYRVPAVIMFYSFIFGDVIIQLFMKRIFYLFFEAGSNIKNNILWESMLFMGFVFLLGYIIMLVVFAGKSLSINIPSGNIPSSADQLSPNP